MSIFRLSLSNIIQRPLGTLLNLLLLTFGVGLISLILQIGNHVEERLNNNLAGVDLVIGAKGSPMQLILSAIYHIDAPTGNISLDEAESIAKNRLIDYAIPLSYGDSYMGYRIVGTSHSYADLYQARLSAGDLWKQTFEVTIGATVAHKLGLSLDDTFFGSHGLTQGGAVHEDQKYRVVGIFNYSGTVLDQLILTSSESVWTAHDHESNEDSHEHEHKEHHEHEHDESHEITAMLVGFKNPTAMIRIPRMINEDTNMQAAIPAYENSRLLKLLGISFDVLNTIGLILLIVSGLSIFISLYNALKDRKYEMAMMRTYGATRWQLVRLVVQEGVTLTLTGYVFGIMVSRLGLFLITKLTLEHTHYFISDWSLIDHEWLLLSICFAIGLLASLLPASHAFRLNISKTLADA